MRQIAVETGSHVSVHAGGAWSLDERREIPDAVDSPRLRSPHMFPQVQHPRTCFSGQRECKHGKREAPNPSEESIVEASAEEVGHQASQES